MTEHCHCGHHHEEEEHLRSPYEQAFSKFDLNLTDESVHNAVLRLIEEKKSQYDTEATRLQLLSTLELTTLKVTDSQESVLKFTEKVNRFADEHPDLPRNQDHRNGTGHQGRRHRNRHGAQRRRIPQRRL